MSLDELSSGRWGIRQMSRRLGLSFSFLLSAALAVSAQDKIGETVYLDGEVSLTRNGNQLDASAVVTGIPIDNFDLMETGDDGTAQVRITAPQIAQSTITVSQDTQFTFELSRLEGRENASINLISGSLSLKVSKLGGNQAMDVQTESVALGIRGTDFAVTTSDAGDVLVTCTTGDVACRTQDGTEYHAVPGTVVENQGGRSFRTISVAVSDVESYRKTWTAQRAAAVKANAPRLIQTNVGRYQQLRSSFDRDYTTLMRQRAVLSKWESEDTRGAVGSADEIEHERAAVGATLARLRSTQFLLERTQYRLLRLKVLHDQGYGRGSLPGAGTTSQFFDQLQKEHAGIDQRMAAVRNATRLYARRNGGADPTSYAMRFRPNKGQTSGPQGAASHKVVTRSAVGQKRNASVVSPKREESPKKRQRKHGEKDELITQ